MTKIDFTFMRDYPKLPYMLGFDIGTNSIGFAVTDCDYKLVRKKGKDLWGVRTFSSAEPAEARRMHRTARRRRKKERYRINLLQEFFAEAIYEKDPGFYQRLKDSYFYAEDKQVNQPYTLFNDPDFTDVDYHKKYPTIYHLRHELANSKEYHDPRLVYLACSHIFRNRGHFLWSGTNLDTDSQLSKLLEELNDLYKEELGAEALFDESRIDELVTLFGNQDYNPSEKARMSQDYLIDKKDTVAKAWTRILVGNNGNLVKLFPSLEESEDEDKDLPIKSIKFSDDVFEESETQSNLETVLESAKGLLDKAYEVYSASILQALLTDKDGVIHKSISEARIATYEDHASDLALLKALMRKVDEFSNDGVYKKVFVENDKNLKNYTAYAGHSDDERVEGSTDQAEFNKYLSSIFKEYGKNELFIEYLGADLESWRYVESQVKTGRFMPKIRSSENGAIPQQLHGVELKKILENACTYIDGLSEDDSKKIEQLFAFRVPYYVGPLDTRNREYSWLEKRPGQEHTSIRPWNIEDVVDLPKTAANFIERMTGKCTYLFGEDVLPKQSLLYAEFTVRNVLNNVKVNGEELPKDLRDALFDDLFENPSKSGRVTKRKIAQTLKGYGKDVTENQISGMDSDIPGKLDARRAFQRITGDKLKDHEIEQIIRQITIFPDSPDMIRAWLERQVFGERLDEKAIKAIASLKFKDWGRLSRKLLSGIKHDCEDGISRSIIQMMRDYPLNLMELLSDKYSFSEQIEEVNLENAHNPYVIDDETLDHYYMSPAVKKAVRQVLLLSKELFKILGGVPEKIFVEMARERQVSSRTSSRKERLMSLYADLKESPDYRALYAELEKTDNDRLKSRRLYLYYTQLGRCMYSGEKIDLYELFDSNKYDLDHIYPRSQTKDDSWTNLVLVKQGHNRIKGDGMIKDNWQENMKNFWYTLLKKDLINTEKYKRLMRKTPLSSSEKAQFINRQLVETRQSTKAISEILGNIAQDSRVVYVKSRLVSDFRYNDGTNEKAKTKFYFPKCRNLNKLHHAKDAYLNIVVGNAYDEKFTKRFWKDLEREDKNNLYTLNYFFDHEVKNGTRVAWLPGEDGSIAMVKRMMRRNNCLLSHEVKKYSGGLFTKQQPRRRGGGNYPLKTGVPSLARIDRYGAYESTRVSHFCFIEHSESDGRRQINLVDIPLYLGRYDFNEDSLLEYFRSNDYKEVEIIYPEIKIGSILELVINGQRLTYVLKGKTGDRFSVEAYLYPSFSPELEEQYKILERYFSSRQERYDEINEVLNACFQELVVRLTKYPFNVYSQYERIGRKCLEELPEFKQRKEEEKYNTLMSMIDYLSGANREVNLKSIGLSENTGRMQLAINSNRCEELYVLNKSITGFYENKVRIF